MQLDEDFTHCYSLLFFGGGCSVILFQHMTMMFEVQDLAVASPATVSRCGMVYLEPSILKLNPFVECWLKTLEDCAMSTQTEKLRLLFSTYLEVIILDIVCTSSSHIFDFTVSLLFLSTLVILAEVMIV